MGTGITKTADLGGTAPGAPIATGRPAGGGRRLIVTVLTVVLTPLLLAGCGWLGQHPGSLALTLSIVPLLIVLCVAWALCGAGPGAGVAAFGFALALFVGPAMNDYVMEQRGERHPAKIADVEAYHLKHSEGHTCSVVRTDLAHSPTYTVEDTEGCEKDMRPGQSVTLVADPEGWLGSRLSTDVHGVSAAMLWTCGGLLGGMEALVLYGRLRRRRT
ncbi:hypothetical protein [Streptomyces sp. NPDC006691]|uniref:hypothetical protein n=1 Tax=Streptomyces sp. NPDC006691 TaxID=3364757 RepID=UPI0036D1762E